MDLSGRSHRLYARAVWITALLPAPVLLLVFHPASRTWRLGVWLAGYATFLAAMALARRRPRRVAIAITCQVVAALVCAWALATSAEGAMLVVVASQMAERMPLRAALAASVAQTAVFAWCLGLQRSLELAVDVPIAWLGFQVFAILLTHVARSEAQGRIDLVERNLQLLATRQLLAERTRAAERLRLARDLHDGLGHHLTALSLNLEAASHAPSADAPEHLRRARAVTRTLLDEVRATVSGVRDEAVDPMQAIRAVVGAIDDPAVHVIGPSSLPVADDDRADTLLRMAQEIVTNAYRHGRARNVYITVRHAPGAIELEGRDDGVGAATWHDGNGLRGMRERLALVGGTLEVQSSPGVGFCVLAHLPNAGPVT